MFDKYRDVILSLPEHIHGIDDCLVHDLSIAESERIGTWYAPFETVNLKARLVLLGVTPGPIQTVEALEIARRLLESLINRATDSGE